MLKTYLNKNSIISLILVITTISMPLAFIPRTAKAQVSGVSINAAAQSLPLCQSDISTGMSNLFNGIGNLLSSNSSSASGESTLNMSAALNGAPEISADQYAQIEASLNSSAQQAASALGVAANSVPVSISGTVEGQAINQINKNTQATKIAVDSMQKNETCLQSIGRLVVKMLLQKITLSTVDWINHGFNGSPAFVQDPTAFFKDIAKTEILKFGVEINGISPFSQSFLQSQALAFNQKFADNARYSLNDLIQQTTPQYTATDFNADFSQGGWDAWSYLTQVPANNPLGFQLLASNELQQRLAGTSESTAQNTRDALQQAGGFLGDMRCVDSNGQPDNSITQASRTAALIAGQQDPCTQKGETWQYVTPGKLIADAATSAINYPTNSLLKAQDLNDAIAAITDAVISHFTNQWITNGFANLNTQGSDGSLVYNSGTIGIDTTTQTQKDFTPAQLTSSWLAANPNFNIRTDLTQALVDTQRTYADKLTQQDNELMSTTDGKDYAMNANGQSNAYGLIPAIYQLDYCIPGPHPGWQSDSQQVLNAVMDKVVPQTQSSLNNVQPATVVGTAQSLAPIAGISIGTAIVKSGVLGSGLANGLAGTGTTLGTAVAPIVGTIIGLVVGSLLSGILGSLGNTSEDPNQLLVNYYSAQIQALTGYFAPPGTDLPLSLNIESQQGMAQGINVMLNKYADLINKFYDPSLLPSSAPEAAQEFYKIQGYSQMIDNNQSKITSMKSLVNQLETIKTAVDGLNSDLAAGNITNDQYESDLKPEMNSFANISTSMVNENDIAYVDNLTQQIISEKDYVYDSLLKGPGGCESDLQHQLPNGPFASEVYHTKRMEIYNPSTNTYAYPFPILYDYNAVSYGRTLPDPWHAGSLYCSKHQSDDLCQESQIDNTMTFYTNSGTTLSAGNAQGPGFLSYVVFEDYSTNGAFSNPPTKVTTPCDSLSDNSAPDNWCVLQTDQVFPMPKQGDTGYGNEPTVGSSTWMSSSKLGSSMQADFDACLLRADTGYVNSGGASCVNPTSINGQFERIMGIY